MSSPNFVPLEHSLAQRQVEGETDVAALGSPMSRAGGGGRRDLIAPGRLVVGTELMSDVTVVSLAGEIDLATVKQFAGALRMHLDDGAHTVVIDLAEIGFISADGGRVMLTAIREAQQRGVIMRLVLSRAVRRVVTLLAAIAEGEASTAIAILSTSGYTSSIGATEAATRSCCRDCLIGRVADADRPARPAGRAGPEVEARVGGPAKPASAAAGGALMIKEVSSAAGRAQVHAAAGG